MTGKNPKLITHSHTEYCIYHKQHVAEITPNYITWRRLMTLLGGRLNG